MHCGLVTIFRVASFGRHGDDERQRMMMRVRYPMVTLEVETMATLNLFLAFAYLATIREKPTLLTTGFASQSCPDELHTTARCSQRSMRVEQAAATADFRRLQSWPLRAVAGRIIRREQVTDWCTLWTTLLPAGQIARFCLTGISIFNGGPPCSSLLLHIGINYRVTKNPS